MTWRPAGVVRRAKDGVRILGNGELKAKLALTVHHATASAKAAIEKARRVGYDCCAKSVGR